MQARMRHLASAAAFAARAAASMASEASVARLRLTGAAAGQSPSPVGDLLACSASTSASASSPLVKGHRHGGSVAGLWGSAIHPTRNKQCGRVGQQLRGPSRAGVVVLPSSVGFSVAGARGYGASSTGTVGQGPVGWMSLAMVCVTGGGLLYYYEMERARRLEAIRAGPSAGKASIGGPFTLKNANENGKKFSTTQLHGKFALLYFGFTMVRAKAVDVDPAASHVIVRGERGSYSHDTRGIWIGGDPPGGAQTSAQMS